MITRTSRSSTDDLDRRNQDASTRFRGGRSNACSTASDLVGRLKFG